MVNRTGDDIEVTEVRFGEKQAPPIYVESDEDDMKDNIDGDKGAGGGDDGADCGN